MVHFSADLSLWLDSQCSGHPDTKACPPTPRRLFPVPPERQAGVWMCKLGVICQERLKIEIKLLWTANRKSYMPRRLAQQRMTLSDLEWSFYTSRAISAVAELLVIFCTERLTTFTELTTVSWTSTQKTTNDVALTHSSSPHPLPTQVTQSSGKSRR